MVVVVAEVVAVAAAAVAAVVGAGSVCVGAGWVAVVVMAGDASDGGVCGVGGGEGCGCGDGCGAPRWRSSGGRPWGGAMVLTLLTAVKAVVVVAAA